MSDQNPQMMRCKQCGHEVEYTQSAQDVEFARQFHEKTIVSVWVCPVCSADNSTTVSVFYNDDE